MKTAHDWWDTLDTQSIQGLPQNPNLETIKLIQKDALLSAIEMICLENYVSTSGMEECEANFIIRDCVNSIEKLKNQI